jgi:hypothetical protein
MHARSDATSSATRSTRGAGAAPGRSRATNAAYCVALAGSGTRATGADAVFGAWRRCSK